MPRDDAPGPLDTLTARRPACAGDLRRNLRSAPGESRLSPQQLWGTLLVTAIASRSAEAEAEAEARVVVLGD